MVGTPDLVEAYTELVEARDAYEKADEFYEGDCGDVYSSPQIRALLVDAEMDVEDFNYAKIPVDVISGRLRLAQPAAVRSSTTDDTTSPVPGDGKPANATAADQALAQMWRHNQLDAESKHLHQLVSRHGDAYLFIAPVIEEQPADPKPEPDINPETAPSGGDDPEEDPTDGVPAAGRVVAVDILVNSAHTVRAIYDPGSPLRPAYVIKAWEVKTGKGKVVRANLYYDDHTEKWATDPGTTGKDPRSWHRPAGAEDDIPNPYGRQPFWHFRNSRPYGTPEHKSVYAPQRMVNKLVAAHAASIEIQAFPQRYYLADPTIDDPSGNLSNLRYPDDDGEDPTDGSALESGPAAVWKLYGKTVGQFDPPDPQHFLQPFDRYVRSMSELSGLPQHYFGVSTGQTPSGAALRVLDKPTVGMVVDRQEAYGPSWQDAYEWALRLLGIEGYEVPCRWRPASTVDDLEGWQIVRAKVEAGVPMQQALRETGYSGDEVEAWAESAEGADLARRISLLVQLGTAVQTLGAGVGLGVVDAAQVKALVSQLVGHTAQAMEPAPDPAWPEPKVEIPTAAPVVPAQPRAPVPPSGGLTRGVPQDKMGVGAPAGGPEVR